MSSTQDRSGIVAVGLSTTGMIMASLPVFLTGALSVELTGELGFGAAALGVAIAFFRGTAAVASVPLGRLVDRIGPRPAFRMAATVSAVATLGIALTARSWLTLVPWLMLASLAVTPTEAASNGLLLSSVKAKRQGIAFGIKQSALPAASMVAGFSVPVIALTLGWRYAFGLGAVLALVLALGVGRMPASAPKPKSRDDVPARLPERDTVLLLALAFGLTMAASQTIPVFFVETAVQAGLTQRLAGSLLAVASAATIANRLVFGVVTDRLRGGHLRLCATGMAVSAVGFVLLALGHPLGVAVGALIALVGTWGFSGVFWYALMRAFPEAPGRLTGAVLPVGLLGGTLSPMVFGFMVEGLGYPAAWTYALAVSAVAAAAMWYGSYRLARRPAPSAP